MSARETILQHAAELKQTIADKKNHVSTHQLRAWRKRLKRYQYVLNNKLNGNTHKHTTA